jgi:hypothetical protein
MFLFLMSIVLISCLSNNIFAQWADNKNAREDAMYARYLQGAEDVIVDGIEEPVWALADSIVVGYGQTNYLPGSGYDLWAGQSMPGDSSNAVFKCLVKPPYIYLLFRVVDLSVGGWDWGQSDALILAFKENTGDHSWVEPWDKRMEHFYTRMYKWAYADSFSSPPIGEQPLFMGNNKVAGGLEAWRNAAQKERWTAFTNVIGISNDSLPDVGYISEHRIRIDSLGFNPNSDVLPFSFSIFDGDRYLDSTDTNDSHNRTWWGCPWNENWYYAALFLNPNVTTSSTPGVIPPPDYNIPHVPSGTNITIDGDLSDWDTDYALHFRAKWQDEAGFSNIKGTGDWASGYMQFPLSGQPPFPTVIDGPEVDYWVTYDDANLYVSAQVTDQIVTKPLATGQKDGITFTMVPRHYVNGNGIFPALNLTVRIDSSGNAQAGDNLISLADTGGVEFASMLGDQTDINDWNNIDNGFFAELKIPFSTFSYPVDKGDSVVFIAAMVNDIDIFDDTSSNTYSSSWWFGRPKDQHAPAWVTLGPAIPVGVNDQLPIPFSIQLFDNYPNPFNPSTTIKYSINVTADVTLSVYDILGQVVSVMKKTNVKPGYDEFQFNAANLASGIYLYQLKVENLSNAQVINTKVNKMVLLK